MINSHRQTQLITVFVIIAQWIPVVLYLLGYISVKSVIGAQGLILYSMVFLTCPKIGILIFLFIRPLLDYGTSSSLAAMLTHNGLNPAGMMTIIVLALGLIYMLMHQLSFTRAPLAKHFLIFLLVCLVSVALSEKGNHGVSDWIRLVAAFVFYNLIWNLFKTKKDLTGLLGVIAGSAIIPVLVGFYQKVTHSGVTTLVDYELQTGFHRIMGTFNHPNAYAFYLVILLPFIIIKFLESFSSGEKITWGFLSLGLSIGLMMTMTRGAWLGAACSLCIMGVFRYRKFLTLAIVLITVIVLLTPELQDRFSNEIDPYVSYSGSLLWRISLWKNSLPFIALKPLLGIGFGNYANISTQILGTPFGAHNDYLRIVIETGFIGLLVFLWFLFSVTKKAFMMYQDLNQPYAKGMALAFLALCISYMLISITDNLLRLTVVQIYFWALAAMTFNLYAGALNDEKTY